MVIAVIVAAFIYVMPTFKPELWPHKQINLGLDLQGGMHLVLEVRSNAFQRKYGSGLEKSSFAK